MSERRYSDEEISRILDRATDTSSEHGEGTGSSMDGLTLPELKEIGAEVGIPGEAIARAAADLDGAVTVPAARRRFLGTTIGVGRSVDLPRRLTRDEWNRLVVDLRMTFDAKGKIREEGAFRQWSNGNLQALLEPTESGERLRLRTLKGQAIPFMAMGGAMLGFSALSALGALVGGGPPLDPDTLVLAGVGMGFLGWARIPLPRWARTRERQMEEIAARVRESVREADGEASP